jgi:hypothetical protein
MKSRNRLGLLIISAILATGCAATQHDGKYVHLWKEIRGLGVPYKQNTSGEAVIVGDLASQGCRWLPKGTKIYLEKPWYQSPYTAVYAYKLPLHLAKLPCTAEIVDGGLVYFSYAVVPAKSVRCRQSEGRRLVVSDHKQVIPPK